MRHFLATALLLSAGALTACGDSSASVDKAFKDMTAVDESNMSDIMLTVADPKEAVSYFSRAVAEHPGRSDLQRNLAKSHLRAGQAPQAIKLLETLTNGPEAKAEDRVTLAEALIRSNDWARAEAVLNTIPPTHESFERYRLEAMVADSRKNWKKADSFYEIAAGMTNRPAGVLNNWGFSRLNRGDFKGAEKLFQDALSHDPRLFTAKNNLVMARGAQRKYDLPVVEMTQSERAELLHTLALTAIKSGDVATGRSLLQEALETHPQHFDAAARALRALDGTVKQG